jgi:translation initiation factor 2D
VLEKLQGGADLMTPGLTKWDPEIKSGEVVAVTLQDGIPIAVGVAAFNLGQLSKAVGEKGKAVYIVHCYRDELWTVGSKKHPPKPVLANGNTDLEDATLQLSLDPKEDDQQVSNEDVVVDVVETLPEPAVEESRGIEPEPSTTGTQSWLRADADIDNAFKAAAIYGLYQIKMSDAHNSLSLPMLSSTLVSNHLNPYLLEPFAQMNFKKTSWKKAATFLKKYLEKEGVVKTKDRAGETVILSINWNHKLITEFEPYGLGHQGPAKSAKNDTVSSRSMITVHELYKPSGKAFKALLESISKPYLSDELIIDDVERMIYILYHKSASV